MHGPDFTDIFDTHAHYNDEAFQEDGQELLASLPGQGIARVVNVGQPQNQPKALGQQ